MRTTSILLAALGLCGLALCAGCVGEGESEFRPTPGIINVSY